MWYQANRIQIRSNFIGALVGGKVRAYTGLWKGRNTANVFYSQVLGIEGLPTQQINYGKLEGLKQVIYITVQQVISADGSITCC
jgi:hypothetical protein